MNCGRFVWGAILGILVGGTQQAQALPGQTIAEATRWIQTNPTLRPLTSETTLIRRSATPAQRFTFQASLLQAGRAARGPNGGVIRTEELSLFDMLNGVSRDRLEESLRAVYGAVIFQDYANAQRVYVYPEMSGDAASGIALQGELRAGDRYGYWLEIAQSPEGIAYTGRLTVLLRSDVEKLAGELRSRSS